MEVVVELTKSLFEIKKTPSWELELVRLIWPVPAPIVLLERVILPETFRSTIPAPLSDWMTFSVTERLVRGEREMGCWIPFPPAVFSMENPETSLLLCNTTVAGRKPALLLIKGCWFLFVLYYSKCFFRFMLFYVVLLVLLCFVCFMEFYDRFTFCFCVFMLVHDVCCVLFVLYYSKCLVVLCCSISIVVFCFMLSHDF